MAHRVDRHSDRYVPAVTNGGWGFATFIIFLSVVCIAVATYIHRQTWRQPTDVTWMSNDGGESK